MTPEQITLVQSSFERLGPELPAMATRFYEELFERDPALRPLFTTPLAEQEVKFAVNLGRIAILRGRVATARRYYAEAAGLAQASHFAGPPRSGRTPG